MLEAKSDRREARGESRAGHRRRDGRPPGRRRARGRGAARGGAPAGGGAQRAADAPRRGAAGRGVRGGPPAARPDQLSPGIGAPGSGIHRRMADDRRYELEDLLVRPGTYFNPQTEVLVVVDDSNSMDARDLQPRGVRGRRLGAGVRRPARGRGPARRAAGGVPGHLEPERRPQRARRSTTRTPPTTHDLDDDDDDDDARAEEDDAA